MYELLKQIRNRKLNWDPNGDLFAVIIKWLRTELTYTSNNIEGNTLTREETALTIEKGITSGSKPLRDYLEAKNHAEALDYVVSLLNQEVLSWEDVILKIHSLILNGINDDHRGRYRTVRVRIAGSDAILPNPLKVPYLMEEFAKKLTAKPDDVSKASEAHYKLVEIHPFIDGNGRTARLLMNLILMRAGYLPLIVPPTERRRYIAGIHSRNIDGNLLGYHRYMLKLLLKSVNIYVKLFGDGEPESDFPLMTVGKFAQYCGVPVSTVRYWLRIKKLEPHSYTPAGYMLFRREQRELGRT
jgi:Fic family protein